VHLKGTFAPSRHASAYWRDESKKIGGPVKGRIINTSSTSGIYGNVGQTNYGAAKAGIAAFTIIAARELRRYGVTVNAISPSAQTRMTEGLRRNRGAERGVLAALDRGRRHLARVARRRTSPTAFDAGQQARDRRGGARPRAEATTRASWVRSSPS
jgi:NAD(P)-dependent dehydrogenase (short-subunit alcohol dehydrogenase family)